MQVRLVSNTQLQASLLFCRTKRDAIHMEHSSVAAFSLMQTGSVYSLAFSATSVPATTKETLLESTT